MENKDLDRAVVINIMVQSRGYYNFDWVKKFVFSNILEQYVALAGHKGVNSFDNIVLIDVFGNVVKTNF